MLTEPHSKISTSRVNFATPDAHVLQSSHPRIVKKKRPACVALQSPLDMELSDVANDNISKLKNHFSSIVPSPRKCAVSNEV